MLAGYPHIYYADVDAGSIFRLLNGLFDGKNGFVNVGDDTSNNTVRNRFSHA